MGITLGTYGKQQWTMQNPPICASLPFSFGQRKFLVIVLVSNHHARCFTALVPYTFLRGHVAWRVILFSKPYKNWSTDRVFVSHFINISLLAILQFGICLLNCLEAATYSDLCCHVYS